VCWALTVARIGSLFWFLVAPELDVAMVPEAMVVMLPASGATQVGTLLETVSTSQLFRGAPSAPMLFRSH
jgi:hypothetical protein